MSTRKDARVTLAALDRAVYNRRPRSGVDLPHGSEHLVCGLRVPTPAEGAGVRAEHEPPGDDRRRKRSNFSM